MIGQPEVARLMAAAADVIGDGWALHIEDDGWTLMAGEIPRPAAHGVLDPVGRWIAEASPAAVTGLLDALRRFGTHAATCSLHRGILPCDCGWEHVSRAWAIPRDEPGAPT